jgi:ABC-type multidrug transport system fused ATPase/permease subunit
MLRAWKQSGLWWWCEEAIVRTTSHCEARIQKSLLRLMAGRTSFVIARRLSTIRSQFKGQQI